MLLGNVEAVFDSINNSKTQLNFPNESQTFDHFLPGRRLLGGSSQNTSRFWGEMNL